MRLPLRRILVVLLFIVLLSAFIILSMWGFLGPNNASSTFVSFPRLTFDEPIGFVQPDTDKSYNYVYQKDGVVYAFENSGLTNDMQVFLDLSSKVTKYSNEDGLLGMAFHPNYETNGKFYTFHSEPRDLKYDVNCTLGDEIDFCVRTVLSEFEIKSTDPPLADLSSQRELLELNQTHGYHRGGQVHFGPDGYLYLQIGDGSIHSRSQDLDNLFGSIIRIDVNTQDEYLEYSIPADNPFVGVVNASEEIWAYGLRNPWRGSFDPSTGDLWVGDVGHSEFEEIDVIEKGLNFGWPIFEGFECRQSGNCDSNNFTDPIVAYPHGGREIENLENPLGIASIGGHVYRGSDHPELYGKFILVDYIGTAWSIGFDPSTYEVTDVQYLNRFPDLLSSVGIDENGELIFVGIDQGKLLKMTYVGQFVFWGFIFFYTLALGIVVYKWTRKKSADTKSDNTG